VTDSTDANAEGEALGPGVNGADDTAGDDEFELGAFAADEDSVTDGDTDVIAFDSDADPDPSASEASNPEPADGVERDGPLGEPTTAGDADVVAVSARELAAIRSEMRELRDRVATLESDLAAVRADLARERDADSKPTEGDGVESLEPVDGVDDGD
jgi:hypothetical protein